MIYFDTSCLARLYLQDSNWQAVRGLAQTDSIGCSLHGQTELISAFHRKFREEAFGAEEYKALLSQFELDCQENAFRWFPFSPNVADRVRSVYRTLSKTTFLRAGDAMHLACAAENGIKTIHSNDRRLLEAAPHFGLIAAGPGGSME
jgi:predicted nucleic acid-binding protein